MFDLDRETVLIVVLFLLVIGISVKMYTESDMFNLRCIISRVDGKTYCVRDRRQLKTAADLLAKVTQKCQALVVYVKERYPDHEDVRFLVSNFSPERISETLPTSEHTAYSENKGEKIAFCLNKAKQDNERLIDLNTLTFVAIHELAHCMTQAEGHKQVFWQNFKFLLKNAKESGIYNPVDYKQSPAEYCGMKISDNPYYDLK
jgi:hypothetical protein